MEIDRIFTLFLNHLRKTSNNLPQVALNQDTNRPTYLILAISAQYILQFLRIENVKRKNVEFRKGIQYSARWVLRPPSVRGVEVAKASAAAKARVWI